MDWMVPGSWWLLTPVPDPRRWHPFSDAWLSQAQKPYLCLWLMISHCPDNTTQTGLYEMGLTGLKEVVYSVGCWREDMCRIITKAVFISCHLLCSKNAARIKEREGFELAFFLIKDLLKGTCSSLDLCIRSSSCCLYYMQWLELNKINRNCMLQARDMISVILACQQNAKKITE